jgi:hypothetical protein
MLLCHRRSESHFLIAFGLLTTTLAGVEGKEMGDRELAIEFAGSLPAEAGKFAQNLKQELREVAPSAEISLGKARPDSQDFGTTLVLLFGTPVAIALAKAVTVFLQRNLGASITITKGGTIIAKNLDSKDAARIAEAFAGKST